MVDERAYRWKSEEADVDSTDGERLWMGILEGILEGVLGAMAGSRL